MTLQMQQANVGHAPTCRGSDKITPNYVFGFVSANFWLLVAYLSGGPDFWLVQRLPLITLQARKTQIQR